MVGPLLGAGFYFFFYYRGPFFGLGVFYLFMIIIFGIKSKQQVYSESFSKTPEKEVLIDENSNLI